MPALRQICQTAEVKSPPDLIGPCGHVTGHNNNREFGRANMTYAQQQQHRVYLEIWTGKYDHSELANMTKGVPSLFSTFNTFLGGYGT